MADDDEISVTVDDNDTGAPEGGAGSEPLITDLKEQLATLQSTMTSTQQVADQERARAAEAAAEADRAKRERDAAIETASKTQKETVETGIAAASEAMDAAESEYATAMENGDFQKAAKAQRRIAETAANLARLKEAKDDIERTPRREQQQTPARQTAQADPVEQYAARLTPKSAAWVRAHPEFVRDERKNAKMVAAHHDAVANGMAIESQEYFDHLETFVGIKNAGGTKSEGAKRRESPPAAPVNHSPGGTGGGDGNTVVLTKREAAAATDGTHVWNYDDPKGRFKKGDPIGVQEFARRKRTMLQDGRYERANYDQ